MRENIYEDPEQRDTRIFSLGFIGGALTLGFILFAVAFCNNAKAQDCEEGSFGCGHPENHDQYKEWKTNTGASCCNDQDCRPVRARPEGDGEWSVWVPEIKMWVRVPSSAMQKPDRFRDGRSHMCASKPSIVMPLPYIYCFSPSEPRI